jgi:Domain of unknown function (DUF222)/HNH endonuclease
MYANEQQTDGGSTMAGPATTSTLASAATASTPARAATASTAAVGAATASTAAGAATASAVRPGAVPAGSARAGLVPANAAEALAYAQAGLAYLAAADPASLTGAERADLLRGLCQAESRHLAARSAVLAGFDRAGDYTGDAAISAKSWLRWQARISGAAAGAATGWARRLGAHPRVAAALAAGEISPSWARHIIDWNDRLPEDARDRADKILLEAATDGADLPDLAALAEQIRARTAPPDTDPCGEGDGFGNRRLRLTRHYQGHAHLDGDLTPPAASALQAVLDSLNGRTGPEDLRSPEQRDHDALEEACRRLVAGGLPDRAGQPTQIQLHLTLSQLLGRPEADEAAAAWIAANGVPAPPGADCDAAITPIVTGTADSGILNQLATILLSSPGSGLTPGRPSTAGHGTAAPGTAEPGTVTGTGQATSSAGHGGQMTISAVRQLAIAQAARLLSGPGGLASWLRTSQLDGYAASVSLPLDIGATTDTIPVHLRRAVARRDPHCRFPGCDQRAARCHVHHVVPRSEGGSTSIENCCLLCPFHHLVAVHRWGWKLVLNPDGTTTATLGDITLHSHAPPIAA